MINTKQLQKHDNNNNNYYYNNISSTSCRHITHMHVKCMCLIMTKNISNNKSEMTGRLEVQQTKQ